MWFVGQCASRTLDYSSIDGWIRLLVHILFKCMRMFIYIYIYPCMRDFTMTGRQLTRVGSIKNQLPVCLKRWRHPAIFGQEWHHPHPRRKRPCHGFNPSTKPSSEWRRIRTVAGLRPSAGIGIEISRKGGQPWIFTDIQWLYSMGILPWWSCHPLAPKDCNGISWLYRLFSS